MAACRTMSQRCWSCVSVRLQIRAVRTWKLLCTAAHVETRPGSVTIRLPSVLRTVTAGMLLFYLFFKLFFRAFAFIKLIVSRWRETGKEGENGGMTCSKWSWLELNPGLCSKDSILVHGAPSLTPGSVANFYLSLSMSDMTVVV